MQTSRRDQDVADELIRSSSSSSSRGTHNGKSHNGKSRNGNRNGHGLLYSSCPLPSHQFVGFCSWAWGYNRGNRSHFDQLVPCELVSYHGARAA